ncbi:MAG: cobalamin-dependent protein, partial [Deltaproteobacteria bacterium]|nr:cobalamin-dependent protein [Deltaproteobacteria bacterium]
MHPLGYGKEAAARDISRMANMMPPLGLASMASFLEKNGKTCAVVDCFAQPDSDRVIREYLVSERPAFIGFSCTTSSFL